MWITLDNLNAQLSNATTDETIWLHDFLKFSDKQAHFRRGQTRHQKIELYDNAAGLFPAGLTGLVMEAARNAGFQAQLLDKRKTPIVPLTGQALDDALYWLRDYQREAVDVMHRKTRGIVWATTGAGKTEILTGLVRTLPGRWLMIVHNKKLMHDAALRYELREHQWWLKRNVHPTDFDPTIDRRADEQKVRDALDKLGLKWGDVIDRAGLVGDGHWNPQAFTCCTFQTLAKALRKKRGVIQNVGAYNRAKALLDSADGIIVDECHVLPADSFWGVLMHAANAYYRIGFSGTPLARGDRRSVLAVAALGPVQYRINAERLQDAGVLAKPRIRMFDCYQTFPDPRCGRCKGSGDAGMGPGSCGACKGSGRRPPQWRTVQKHLLVKSNTRNELIVEVIKRYAVRPVLVFVEAVDHGKILQAMLELEGIPAAFTWGKDTTTHREDAINKLISGEVEVLIASRIFQEGVDIPPIRSVVIASGGKSIIAVLQKIGRGMRIDEGKTEFDVFDFNDFGHKWLDRHTKQRVKAYTSEGHTVHKEGPLLLTANTAPVATAAVALGSGGGEL